jgi:hypothetical protein
LTTRFTTVGRGSGSLDVFMGLRTGGRTPAAGRRGGGGAGIFSQVRVRVLGTSQMTLELASVHSFIFNLKVLGTTN